MRIPRLWRWAQDVLHEKQQRLVIGGGVGFFLLLSLLAVAGERGFFEVYRFTHHLDRIEDRLRKLEEDNRRMRLEAAALRSDPYQIEKLAREDLGLARPDEIIFEIVDGSPHELPSPRGHRKE
jgi:cell division protein FtsB